MNIFSFSSGAHDSSYAIYDGKNITCHEELERHTRIKECDGDVLDFYINNVGPLEDFDIITTFPHGVDKWYPPRFNEVLRLHQDKKVEYVEVGHHCSHAANAFFSSNLDEALIVTLDGGGWDRLNGKLLAFTLSVWHGKDNKIAPILRSDEVNLGKLWACATGHVFGMSMGGPPYGCQAGTVMAMAAMGDKHSFKEITHNWDPKTDYHRYQNLSEQEQFDLAARLQYVTEEFVKEFLGRYMLRGAELGVKNLCLSGGTVLNSVMTGKIWDWFPQLEQIYIPPVPYDAGLAIGNIQYVLHQLHDEPRVEYKDNFTPYLGREYSLEEVLSAIDKYDTITHHEVDDGYVLNLIDQQQVVSVFHGGSESGRRALGNRSILADPRNPDMKDIMNEKVKHRQWFRPFAPSILREEVSNWFARDIDSPYMGFVVPFLDDVKDKVPAVVHFDGSARLQTVTANDNEWYYNFIKQWYHKTGVPILLNTSFNDREPIVETPEHAIDCFLKTHIDYLYFNVENRGIIVAKMDNE